MADDSITGLISSTPDFYVGGTQQPGLAAGLNRLSIVENTSGLYRCEARFSNWGLVNRATDYLYFDRRTLDFGKAFQVKLRDKSIFDGRIMGLEAGFPEGQAPDITVLAEDRFQDLRMTRRTRTFADATDADVFRQIASDHGLTPGVDVTGATYKVLAQVNQSDLAFARERARAIDAELWMEGSTLHAKNHSNRGGATLELTRGAQLREFKALADLAMQRTSVTVNGWDVPSKSALTYEATESVITNELNSDVSGVSILQSALGARKEALAHTIPLNSQEAQYEAETYFRMSARRFIVGYGVAETRHELRAGAFVDLKELGPLFSGKYYVTEVRHLFDNAKGIRTEFRAERPGIGRI